MISCCPYRRLTSISLVILIFLIKKKGSILISDYSTEILSKLVCMTMVIVCGAVWKVKDWRLVKSTVGKTIY